MAEEAEREEFHQEDLPLEGFPVMDQIRSEGRLCDIMLKVSIRLYVTVVKNTSMTTHPTRHCCCSLDYAL